MKLYKIKLSLISASFLCLSISSFTYAQCNTNTSICTSGINGPYTFTNPGTAVSTCLDFWGPSYAYINLYITASGPLELLINGNANSGFLDVSIFNIPSGQDPCIAIQNNANEISCNYASSASGCNQIGTFFPCPSSVNSPMVTAGDHLMIVVENWSGAASNFTLELGPIPAAQTGPADPSIIPLTFSPSELTPPFQVQAVNPGGTWSGNGITAGGIFDPAISGPGIFPITYVLGSGICSSSDTIMISVQNALAVEMQNVSLNCFNDIVNLNWTTNTEKDCDYFRIEKSRDGILFETVGAVLGHGTSNEPTDYSIIDEYNEEFNYYSLIEVDYNGTETKYGPFYLSCESNKLLAYPNPTTAVTQLVYNGFHVNLTTIKCFDNMGREVQKFISPKVGGTMVSLESLSKGIYTIVVQDQFTRKIIKISKI